MNDDLNNNLTNKKEACRTYIDQTKLLVSLASAFLIPPATIEVIKFFSMDSNNNFILFIFSEIFFILSILSGYFVLGSITGSQDRGDFNVYRKATRIFSLLQILFYVLGIILFLLIILKL